MSRSGHEESQRPIQLVPPPPSNRRELCSSSTVAPRRRHDYAVDIVPDFPPMFRTSLSSACRLLQESEQSLVESGMASDTNTSLVQLERLLAELGSYPYVSQGVFYMMAVHNTSSSSLCDRDIIRFVESGSFLGFFHNKRDGIPFEGPGYRVYSEADLSDMKEKTQERTASIREIRSAKSGKQVQGRNRSGEVYSKKVKAIQKHIAVIEATAAGLCETLDIKLFVHVVRRNASAKKEVDKYVYVRGMDAATQVLLEGELSKFRLEGSWTYPSLHTHEEKAEHHPLTVQEQMDVLCCLSNNHHRPYPTSDRKLSTSPFIGYPRYLSYIKPSETKEDRTFPEQLPASLRNRFVYFHNIMDVHRKNTLLRHAFAKPKTREAVPEAFAAEADIQIQEIHPRPKKTRRVTERVVKVTAENLRDQLSVCAPNHSMLTLKAYQNFKRLICHISRDEIQSSSPPLS